MESKLIAFICIVFSILLLGACAQSEQTTKLLTQADSIIYSHPDSAKYILDKIADNELTDKEKADYWRLRTTSHVLKGKSTIEDSTIMVSLDYYKNHDMQRELKDTYMLVLNHLFWKGDTANYKYYMAEASSLAENTNDSLFTYKILRSVASDFYTKNEYELAYNYYKKAIEYNDSVPSTFYMAGLAYCQIHNNDTIDYWMQKAIALAKQQKDTVSALHYYRNYTDVQIIAKNYDKALANMREMEQYKANSFHNLVPYTTAIIFLQQHKLDSAQYYLDKTIEQHSGNDADRSFLATKKGLSFFQNLIDYGRGDSFNFSLIGQYTDSLRAAQKYEMIKFEEQLLAKQKLSEQNQALIIKKQRTQLLLLSILFLISIVAITTYIYIKKKKEKLSQMDEKMESLHQLLADVSDDLRKNRENSSYFKKVLLQQLGLIRLTASNPTNQNQEMLQRIAKITNDEIPVDSLIVWEDLYTLIDSLYDNFYTRMQKSYGDVLAEKEIQLCCLLCANFTTKEISVITQQSIRTIYQRKTTIREKLDMQQAEDIVEFIGK